MAGDYVAARRALQDAGRYLADLPGPGMFEHALSWCDLERTSGRPLESLAHLKQAARLISADADHWRAAVVEDKRVSLLLALGDLDAAREAQERFAGLAERSGHIGVIADAVASRSALMAAEDRLDEARDFLEKWLVDRGGELSERPRVQLLAYRAYLASEAGLHDAAESFFVEMDRLLSDVAVYRMVARQSHVRVRLRAGRPERARELAAELAHPSEIPGHEIYRVGWQVSAALLELLAPEPDFEKVEPLSSELDLHRAGEAWGSLASSAVNLLEILRACGLESRAKPARQDALAALREATEKRHLPLASRLLAELAGSGQ
jgi:hypothetical protein